MVVASSARGVRLNNATKEQRVHLNKVILTFYEIHRRQKVSAIGAYSTIAEVKHLKQIDIDKLQNREVPTISQILFQQVAVGQETMVLCTAYGLLVYECIVTKLTPRDKTADGNEEDKRESGREKAETGEDDKQKVDLIASYKISVLPDERVLDCLSFETTANET